MSKDKYKEHQYYLEDNIHQQNTIRETTHKSLPKIYGTKIFKKLTSSSKQNFKRSSHEIERYESKHIKELLNKYLPQKRKMPRENDNIKFYRNSNIPLRISKLQQDSTFYSSAQKISLFSQQRKFLSHQKAIRNLKQVTPTLSRKITLQRLPQNLQNFRLQNQTIHKIVKRNTNPLLLPTLSEDEQFHQIKQHRFKTQSNNINESSQQQDKKDLLDENQQTEKQQNQIMETIKQSQNNDQLNIIPNNTNQNIEQINKLSRQNKNMMRNNNNQNNISKHKQNQLNNKSSLIIKPIQKNQQNLSQEKIPSQQIVQKKHELNIQKSKLYTQNKNININSDKQNGMSYQCDQMIQVEIIESKQIGIDTKEFNQDNLLASQIKQESQDFINKEQQKINQINEISQNNQITILGIQSHVKTKKQYKQIQISVEKATDMESINKIDQSTQIKYIKNQIQTQTLDMLQKYDIQQQSSKIENIQKIDKTQSEQKIIVQALKINDQKINQISTQVLRIKIQNIRKKSIPINKTLFLNLLIKYSQEKDKLTYSQQSIIKPNINYHINPLVPTKQQLPTWIDNYKSLDACFDLKQLIKSSLFKIIPFKNGLYLGQFKEKQRQGLGIFITQKSLFEGEFKNNQKFKGSEYNHQGIYKGKIVNGLRQGTGQFKWHNQQKYIGQWKNGLKHGNGQWKSPNGDYYNGEWLYNKQQGFGIHQSNKNLYKGYFKNYLKHGKGEQIFSNDDSFTGEYYEGKPNGYGEYIWKNGSKYKGTFFQGMIHGYGTIENQGNSYKGIISIYISSIGQFKYDLKDGLGQQIFRDGSSFKGKFQKNLPTQSGEYKDEKGQIYLIDN